MKKHGGFTLIELLVVIAVLAILCTIVIGASSMIMQTSRERRFTITKEVLKVAIMRYRTEYGVWPVSKEDDFDREKDGVYYLSTNNDKVLNALRTCNQEKNMNPDGIRFIDETTIYTSDGDDMIPLHKASGNKGHKIVYRVKNGRIEETSKKWALYEIGFNFRDDSVTVGPDTMVDGSAKDEY